MGLEGGGGGLYQEIPYPQNKHVMFIVAYVILKLQLCNSLTFV